jgi:hypothetical protein
MIRVKTAVSDLEEIGFSSQVSIYYILTLAETRLDGVCIALPDVSIGLQGFQGEARTGLQKPPGRIFADFQSPDTVRD